MGFNEDTAYLGPLFTALQGAGEGAAKGEELMGGLWHSAVGPLAKGPLGSVPGLGTYLKEEELSSRAMQEDARERQYGDPQLRRSPARFDGRGGARGGLGGGGHV